MSGAVKSVEGLRRFRPYPAYERAGVPWLDQSPAHWQRRKMAYTARMYSGGTPSKENPAYWRGDVPWVSPKDMKSAVVSGSIDHISDLAVAETSLELHQPPVVLIVVRGMILAHSFPVAYTTVPVTINQDMKALRLRSDLDPEFFVYLLEGIRDVVLLLIEEAGHGTKKLRTDLWRALEFRVPAGPEQRAIAEFLDRETGKIDALIAKKERLVELLQEKRTALITHAVTKGLDPSAPMRPSGIDWLGDIPAHWDVKRLWHLTPDDRQIMYGIVLPGPHFDGGVPIVKGGDVKARRLRLDRLNRTDPDIEAGYARSRLRTGDIVYAIRGSIGDAELVPAEIAGANITQDAARIAPGDAVLGAWLLYAVKSEAVFRQLEAGALGATIRGINIRDLKRAFVPVPPRHEQEAIALDLVERAARMSELTDRIQEGIERLKEFRTALISAAVTGKVDVREEAP